MSKAKKLTMKPRAGQIYHDRPGDVHWPMPDGSCSMAGCPALHRRKSSEWDGSRIPFFSKETW